MKQADKPSFQHIGLLRKVLSNKLSGSIIYTTMTGNEGIIAVMKGNLIGNANAEKQLNNFLSEPCNKVEWKKTDAIHGANGAQDNWEDPIVVLGRVISHVDWHPSIANALKNVFLKLPPTQIRLMPLHRLQHSEALTYLVICRQSIAQESFSLAMFLHDKHNEVTLKNYLRSIVLGYALGYITGVPKITKESIDKNRHIGFAARMLNRIRGI